MKFTEADRKQRQAMWEERMPQLLANTDRRPYWQFRTADDGQDNAVCQALHGRIERFDAAFWDQHLPAKCTRLDCRCTIRAYASADGAE